jgi:PAS domain S-box-containing protein
MSATRSDHSAASSSLYRLVFEGVPQPILIVDLESRRVVRANRAAAQAYGYPREDLVGQPLSALWPRADEALPPYAPQPSSRHVRRGGQPMEVSVSVQEISFGGAPALALYVRSLGDEAFPAAVMREQARLLEMVARGEPLVAVLEELVASMERLSGAMIGSVLLLDTESGRARHGAALSLPPAYWQAIDDLAIGPRAGSCGTAMFLNETVVSEDIAADPLWESYREIALAHGLRACWAVPIRSHTGRVLGALAMYYRRPGLPPERDKMLVGIAAHLACLAIERDHAERALEPVRAEERARISREIHDELGQMLTALHMSHAMLLHSLRCGAETVAIATEVATMRAQVGKMLATVRRITAGLRPAPLDELGLAAAVERHAAEFMQRCDIGCRVRIAQDVREVDPERATALFRILQEALANVARHAAATDVEVELRRDARYLRMTVADNGCGIEQAPRSGAASLGLRGMAERAAALGGTVSVTGAPGRGTRVEVRIPAH